jgi:hypothetical protein
MALDVNRWLKYAKARLDAAVGSGNKRLDDLEARREIERGERPWTEEHDGLAPTIDQVRERIEQEEARQGIGGSGTTSGRGVPDRPEPTAPAADPDPAPSATEPVEPAEPAPSVAPDHPNEPAADDTPSPVSPTPETPPAEAAPTAPATPAGPAPRSPQEQAEDAEREMARLELEARQRASADRLDEIRRELGVEPPATPDGDA